MMSFHFSALYMKYRGACSYLLVVLCFTCISVITHAQSRMQAKKGLRAAVVKIDISPDSPKQLLGYGPRLSTGIHDKIYHRIIVLDDGFTKFVLVSTDICLVSPSEYDHVASLLKKKLGIDPVNFWWSASHTHSAPEVGVPGLPEVFMGERYKHDVDTAYTSFIERTLISGVSDAMKKLEPAKMGVGWGYSQSNINRRAIDVDGSASLGLNPDGPVDRRIGIIKIDKQTGGPLAILANYPIHGTVLGGENVQISGDVTGVVADYVEKKTGATVLFINGAAGNLAPIYSVYPNPSSGHLSQFRVLLGDKIIDANSRIIAANDSVRFITSELFVESPRKENLGWPADLKRYTRTDKSGTHMVKLPVRFLKINDNIAIWAAPLELFCEISNEIRERSPFAFTMYYGYTNGWLGYLPSEDEWKYGGYEVNVVSPFTPFMSRHIIESVSAFMDGELKSK